MTPIEIAAFQARAEKAEAERDDLKEALERIKGWSEAYPPDVFLPMDADYTRRAHEVLTANGMTLDRLSAHAMRHVVSGVGDIARAALGPSS